MKNIRKMTLPILIAIFLNVTIIVPAWAAKSSNTDTLYLAYGSNININQMAHRCPDAKIVGSIILSGYQIAFRGTNGAAVANIEKSTNSSVPVLVWDLTTTDQSSLDRYEGYPRKYHKEYLTVMLNGKQVKAMAYIMNGNSPLGRPSQHYYNIIMTGYKNVGFNLDTLNKSVLASAN